MRNSLLLLPVLFLQPLLAADVTFLRDVAPILNKVGCTSGPCHGAAKGKNGFKLSLRGYDPQFDYEALLYDLYGRRFNRAEPGRSLMLAKPTQQVPHGGGLRFERGDPALDLRARLLDRGLRRGQRFLRHALRLRALLALGHHERRQGRRQRLLEVGQARELLVGVRASGLRVLAALVELRERHERARARFDRRGQRLDDAG